MWMDGAASQGNAEPVPPLLLLVPFLPLFPSCATAAGNKGEAEHWHWGFLAQTENDTVGASFQ